MAGHQMIFNDFFRYCFTHVPPFIIMKGARQAVPQTLNFVVISMSWC
jgi:hypothetical protein